ncbi:MAG: helix-turn-helix domain-containing protein [Phycisphaerae bacterium]|nr:helix-turn-helix domain-containing protein [Phycisphaerae bacterium]
MRSHEILKRAADRVGVKALAAELRLSPALIYKWCQEFDATDPDASGARNPLDRLSDLVRLTGDHAVVNWLCHEANGFFVRNPAPPTPDISTELLINTQRLVKEFSDLLLTVTRSIEDDGQIEPHEADRIRQEWEVFKSYVESFVVACEQGAYRSKRSGQ